MDRILARWVGMVASWPLSTLLVIAVITTLLGQVSITRFQMNSNLSDLIRQDAPWRDDFDSFRSRFPQLVDTAVVVVSGTSMQGVEDTSKTIHRRLMARSDMFSDVYSPMTDPFFRDNAFLMMEFDALESMVDRLAEAQPMLTRVAEDPSLRSVFSLVRDGLENEAETGFDRVLRILADSAESLLAGDSSPVRWADEFFDSGEKRIVGLIILRGKVDYSDALPNALIMQNLRAEIAASAIPDDIDVAVTGEIALSHEEIKAAQDGVRIAGFISLGVLLLVLGVGIRSVRIIGATFAMIGIGIIWTTGYALLTVGEFNTMSIIFLVMFFGLGVSSAVHFSLRFREAMYRERLAVKPALERAGATVGRAILLCAVTTAIGFMGFAPTDYKGLGDLGIISAGGMIVAFMLTFTLLPAVFVLVGMPGRAPDTQVASGDLAMKWLSERRTPILVGISLMTIVAAAVGSRMYFDYSVLALRDPDSESMRTLALLQEEEIVTDYTLSILTQDDQETRNLNRLLDLPTVGKVTTPFDYVPKEQEDKLFLLEDAQDFLFSALEPGISFSHPTSLELADGFAQFKKALRENSFADSDLDHARVRLLGAVARIEPVLLEEWQSMVISGLVQELDWLRRAILAEEIRFDDLPASLRIRLVSSDGDYLSTAIPALDISDVTELSRFIEEVRAEVPFATGRPVLEWGVGNVVVNSFVWALVFAVVGIGTVLTVFLRRALTPVLVLIPLALTALFTVAVAVLIDMPLNMANILVIPLIFGLGVDNGIHVVERFRRSGAVAELMHSSTPRAVVLSTLTTIGTFAALTISPHQGTASIGYLLTLAVSLLLLFTLFILPLLLTFQARVASDETSATP